mgnify:CR=1 FL=1
MAIHLLALPKNQIGLLKPHWEALRDHHAERTNSFHSYYETALFDKRAASLLKRDQLGLFVCTDVDSSSGDVDRLSSEQIAAFAICSLDGTAGEVDSLYVSPHSRGLDLGSKLLSEARRWFDGHGATSIRLYVGDGNEDVIEFYAKNGFKVRATQMQWIDPSETSSIEKLNSS